MSTLFSELKRRNVFKVATGYIILGWVVLQVGDVLIPMFELPDWTLKFLFFIGSLGFPFALLFAWAYELTPDGLKRDHEVNPEESITNKTGQKLNLAIMGLLVIGMSYFIWESRFMDDQTNSKEVVNAGLNDNSGKNATDTPTTLGTSIAVLPFLNMSSDPEQEYFSDGITEEILNVLAQIPKLKVTSRSSAFSFKGKEIIVSEVAQKLGVKNVLEGSIRKSGNRIRITAQLIDAETDAHLWSETYDRELDDIFAIQDDISVAIVSALKDKLGFNESPVLTNKAIVDIDAHNAYLRGRFFLEKRTNDDLGNALTFFEQAIELAPDYASAWVGKAWATIYLSEYQYGKLPHPAALESATKAIDKALSLDASLAEAHGIKGLIVWNDFSSSNTKQAVKHFEKAIELNPNFAEAYIWYSNIRYVTSTQRLELIKKAVELNPLSILALNNYAGNLMRVGRFEEAQTVIDDMAALEPNNYMVYSTKGELARYSGKLAESTYYIQKQLQLNPENTGIRVGLAFQLYALGLNEQATKIVQNTHYSVLQYAFNDNLELFLSQVKVGYPRQENDFWGSFLRATAEEISGNYKESIKYRFLQGCDDCMALLKTYKLAGDMASYETLYKVLKERHIELKADGIVGLNFNDAEFHNLDGNIELAIESLKKSITIDGFVIDFLFMNDPSFEAVRKHPQWAEVIELSEAFTTKQRQIYLDLIANESDS